MSTYPFREILEHLPLGIAVLDARGSILGVNPQLAVVAGFGADEAIGRSFVDAFAVEGDVERLSATLAASQAGLFELSLSARITDPDGHVEDQPVQVIGLDSEAARALAVFALMSTALRTAVSSARDTKHALNNLLMGLLGHTEILQDMPLLSAEVRPKVDAIMAQAKRIRTEVQTLGAIGRPVEPEEEADDQFSGPSSP